MFVISKDTCKLGLPSIVCIIKLLKILLPLLIQTLILIVKCSCLQMPYLIKGVINKVKDGKIKLVLFFNSYVMKSMVSLRLAF